MTTLADLLRKRFLIWDNTDVIIPPWNSLSPQSQAKWRYISDGLVMTQARSPAFPTDAGVADLKATHAPASMPENFIQAKEALYKIASQFNRPDKPISQGEAELLRAAIFNVIDLINNP